MKKYFEILCKVSLFQDINPNDLDAMLSCLLAETAQVEKNEILLMAGEKPKRVGIVLSGRLQVIKESFEGERTIMAILDPCDLFAEALCCAGVQESPVTVIADSDCTVMLVDFQHILQTCSKSCVFHHKLIENMLRVIAEKNLFLQNRMDIVRKKSVREKVLTYLEAFTLKQGRSVTIPLNREEMANYLCVERSALSHELMKMKRDGILSYSKNSFTLF